MAQEVPTLLEAAKAVLHWADHDLGWAGNWGGQVLNDLEAAVAEEEKVKALLEKGKSE